MKLFHFHKPKPIAVNYMIKTTGATWIGSGPPTPLPRNEKPVTCVLTRCECGHLATTELLGHWTLEQVTAPTTDKEFLSQAGVKL